MQNKAIKLNSLSDLSVLRDSVRKSEPVTRNRELGNPKMHHHQRESIKHIEVEAQKARAY